MYVTLGDTVHCQMKADNDIKGQLVEPTGHRTLLSSNLLKSVIREQAGITKVRIIFDACADPAPYGTV